MWVSVGVDVLVVGFWRQAREQDVITSLVALADTLIPHLQ